MIFDGSSSHACIKLYKVIGLNIVKIRSKSREYISVLAIGFIPDINLYMPAQCDIGLSQDINVS
ncbi:hypothetical protein SAMN04487964_12514 [Marinobacterium sediminicola]|uniref:Uncharacterized protein n=1 Tax=Marinobacterium sediminicola TaxID=518898 RepID=A0ABY1S4D1_9GAMM|nr:hypothetical protein SAMN04487964_12514 [Marinobacterium sediminicola]